MEENKSENQINQETQTQPEVQEVQEVTTLNGSDQPAPQPQKVQSPHDDFDWDTSKRNVRSYSKEEREKFENMYSGTFVTVNNNEIIKGIVVSMTNTDVVLNIGFKSDGLVPLSEFRDMPDLKVGEQVEVMVVDKENPKGQLILSRKSAKMERAWERIVSAHQTGEVVTGLVTSKTKGGLIVDLFGMETFLPVHKLT